MNILLISQCSKNALKETRRILDQFAERRGDRTWQTPITLQGLQTLHKMLRKTARKNTAIACHWIRGKDHSELMWIVGDTKQFNAQGTTPTNTTERNILRSRDENDWHHAEDIALLAAIAGLFHDFGKANDLFQEKLKPGYSGNISEPYRHEWISLQLFQAFVNKRNDRDWMENLTEISADDETALLQRLKQEGQGMVHYPFESLPPLAKTVAWLVLSHHRLPKHPDKTNPLRFEDSSDWLEQELGADWNSLNRRDTKWNRKQLQSVWTLSAGTALLSNTWRNKAANIAKSALSRSSLINTSWMEDPFTLHLARLFLMLGDHIYSGRQPTSKWQDDNYSAYANTDRETGLPKQHLDEHLIGVAITSLQISRSVPNLRTVLPSLGRHSVFKKRAKDSKYHWQNRAYDLARSIRERSEQQGFFGINMASTGCGKTFANGRIIYGLSNEKTGCRFNVALGLRTLTLQTGDALRERLHLDDGELGVLIGFQAVRELHEHYRKGQSTGSESADDLFDEKTYVHYEGTLDDGRLSHWLKQKPRLHKLVSAPILVSTIDYLIPATEADRGGKQIAPMLRLLTSDLVLDEPDDFDLNDLPALTRLVNWAGMLGSRVLLSSATLPPSLVRALFEAYLHGRRIYQNAVGEPGRPLNVCCAWFDENRADQSDHAKLDSFDLAHHAFVEKRVAKLQQNPAIRQAELLPVKLDARSNQAIVHTLGEALSEQIHRQHQRHHQPSPETGHRISVGLIRMANIDPLVAVAQRLLVTPPQPDHHIHYCIYHSQHPLAVRSAMEQQLDALLNRHDQAAIWRQPVVRETLNRYPEKDHIFVVLATSVAEVGRDHDYDWAIAEPSSMRSLIQLAGRVQRHRNQVPSEPNIIILNGNFRALRGDKIAYTKPGFESDKFKFKYKNLERLLTPEQYNSISAIPRITERESLKPRENLVDLEHAHLAARLFGSHSARIPLYAALWWQQPLNWSYELQQQTPFRQSAPDETYVLYMEDEYETPTFRKWHPNGELKETLEIEVIKEPEIAQGISVWGYQPYTDLLTLLADELVIELAEASKKFGNLRLTANRRWLYSPILGAHCALEN